MRAVRRRPPPTPPRSTRARRRQAVSYAESSGDNSDSYEESSDAAVEEVRASTPKSVIPSTNPRKRAPPTRLRVSPQRNKARSSKRRRTAARITSKRPKETVSYQTIAPGVIPPWQTLPYHVWSQIFRLAAYPLYDDHTFHPSPSKQWLLTCSRMCRAFAEPALTVLYSSPPLVPMSQAHQLVDLLKSDPKKLLYMYRQKIESLQIDVGQVVAYSLPGSGHLDLHGLIVALPRLQDLEFYHQKDMSPYRELDDTIKWTYPESIFDALEYVNPDADSSYGDKTSSCRLRSWRWSSRMAGKKWSIEKLSVIHLKPSFQSLRKVSLVNYQVPTLKKEESDPKHEALLAEALNVLPSLEHIVFESSTLVNAKLLPLLPTSLRHFELINCWEVVASDFADFLLTHGHQLRCLKLDHNDSLSLAFLPILGSACPNLQTLHMTFTYYNVHTSYKNSEPLFEQLLLPDQVPVWPSTLQVIELIQMRKWETEAAEMFFQSLLDSASTLPDLRRLIIQAILNIGWRDRASFRDKWVGSLQRVFKRSMKPPMVLQTLRPAPDRAVVEITRMKQSKKAEHSQDTARLSESESASASSSDSGRRSSTTSLRRSARARKVQSGSYAESSDEERVATGRHARPSKEEIHRGRMARELAILKVTAGHDTPAALTSAEASSDSDEPLIAKMRKGKGREVIQGMCDTVAIRIDNLRPTENQFTEENFIDSEKSGDEDWNGEDGEDDVHAW